MTLTPPTSPGLIWITLSDGVRMLGYWSPLTGYRRVALTHRNDVNPNMALRANINVIAWRPLVPEGDVSWIMEFHDVRHGWVTLKHHPSHDALLTEAEARDLAVAYNKGPHVKAVRIIEVTRRVVKPVEGIPK